MVISSNMIILDGKKLNKEISTILKKKIASFPTSPKLNIIQIGDNSASNVYIKRKIKYAEEIGAKVEVINFPSDILESDVIQLINKANEDKQVNGIIVQLPIPENLNLSKIINEISPAKDVDGLTAKNIYKLVCNDPSGLVPATARGVVTLLQKNNIEISGQKVLVIGRSLLVGKSMALYFLNQNATVTICHSQTKNLKEHTKNADIIVVATGNPGLLNDEIIGENQVIVDVGISIVEGKIFGDADIVEEDKIQAISPVPGGVGPMTVASLFENLVQTCEDQRGNL